MIIELFGLPTTGKTTLAEELASSPDFRLVKIRNFGELFWYNLTFLIRHPLIFLINFLFIVRNSVDWPMFYLKFMNCLLQYNAKYQKAKRYKNAIIDQGHWQNIISIFESPIDEKQLRKYLRYLPVPDLLVVLEAPADLMKKREISRGYFGRENLGAEYQDIWRQTITKNYEVFKAILAGESLNYKIFDASQDKISLDLEIKEAIKNKKIDYLANIRIPTEMGHGYQIIKNCESLGLLGCDLTLNVPWRKNKITQNAFDYYQIKNSFRIKKIKNIDFLSWPKAFGRFKFLLQHLSFLIILMFCEFDRATIIYSRDPEIIWLMARRGYRTVYECHEWFMHYKTLPLFFLKKATRIITTNSFIAEQFFKNGFKKEALMVLPNGIDLENFNLNMTKKEAASALGLEKAIAEKLLASTVLFYSGSLKLKGIGKGVDEILTAIKILNNKNVCFLAVGGSGRDIDYYFSLTKRLGIAEQVFFLPRQNQADLAIYQKIGDIMLMPFPRRAHYEFFMSPLKTFEYMASGRPIIASDLPSIREILNDENCLFCRPGDAADLASQIKKLLSDGDLGSRLSVAAMNDVRSYSWDMRVKKILNFIH